MGFALSDMTLRSPAFAEDGPIPKNHTGEGADTSPALSWDGLPEGTQQLALVCHDPDAPLVTPGHYGFVHWVLYNLPPSLDALPEGFEGGTRGR
ncbi:MAG: YbhB/YbcL family Raf kinase inhibitor-like protein, partial [Pseudomonadales bacterium]